MATPSLLLSLSVWLLSASLVAEATYYRHHRYVPRFYRYRDHSANLLPEVADPQPEVAPQPDLQTYPEIPEVFHPEPEVLHPIPEAFHPVPEVVHRAPEPYRPPEALQPMREASSSPVNTSRVFYGIMFDAGSTGSRIHIYKFIQKDPVELPVLDNELYHAVKPGLSAYKDNPEEGGDTIRQLLKIAKKTVPEEHWERTPVVLKATAGLRLLPEDKASALLKETVWHRRDPSRRERDEKPLRVLAWVTVNFLTGLDWKVFTSSCLPKKFREDVTFGGTTYKVGGIPDGYAGYKLCYREVAKVIKGIVHQPYEVKGSSVFYAFSYYFDRAVESGLIDGSRGGALEVRDFKKRAKEEKSEEGGGRGEEEELTFSAGIMLVACRPKVRRRTTGAASVE
ncbi:Ectonucleoside triphosphate diphosphohydrolase 5 [Liparis tanakae]|uniref:nucleoside diphosphate phosphatase n=1 Tax=Liparis tanakae TaxID=230148 RepID=A0A4Z2GUJ5_9TELE|nr:Ectonucleoside triphosphate diphosphohydrolase 5 [Liparis tanakae]